MKGHINGRGARLRVARPASARRACLAFLLGALALCATASAASATESLKWRLDGVPLTGSTAVQWQGTVKVADSKVLGAHTLGLECEVSAEGTAGGAAASEVTKWTDSKCVPVKGSSSLCEEKQPASLEAVHLPWHGELSAVEGTAHDALTNGGKGTPGFTIVCRALGVESTDKCTGTLGASVSNSTRGATAAFNAVEKLECSSGGAGAGTIEGSQSITAGAGKLSAETPSTPKWHINGSEIGESEKRAVSWAGSVKLSDTMPVVGKVVVSCTVAGEGDAIAGGAGEITKWTLSECSGSEACERTGASLETGALPWSTELFASEGGVGDLITANGKEIEYKLKCKASGTTVQDVCTEVPTAPAITNITGGVSAAFKEKFTCPEGRAGAAELSGSLTVKSSTGTLQVT